MRAPEFAGGLVGCAELSVSLKEVTRNLLKETIRNPVDEGIPSDLRQNVFVLVRVPWLLGVLLLCSCVATRLCV